MRFLISSIVIGMVIGVFALFDNSYITGVHYLDPSSVIVLILIGTGLRTGSLKEYIHGVSEPDNSQDKEMHVTN